MNQITEERARCLDLIYAAMAIGGLAGIAVCLIFLGSVLCI